MQKFNSNENIFTKRNCLSKDELIGYARGTLSEKAKHLVEKHLLDCELCTEALEGIMQLKDPAWLANISDDMVRKMSEKKSAVKKNKQTWYLAAAAVVAVVLLSGIYFQFIRTSEKLKSDYAVLSTKEEKIKLNEIITTPSNNIQEKLRETPSQITPTEKKSASTEPVKAIARQPEADGAVADASIQSVATEEVLPPAIGVDHKKGTAAQTDNKVVTTTAVNERGAVGQTAAGSAVTSDDYFAKKEMSARVVKTTPATKNNLAKFENVSTVAKDKSAQDELSNVQMNMSRENYKEALDELNTILKQNPADVNTLYNTGLVYYKMDKNSKALQYFDKTINNTDKKYFEDARWYKVLTFVKMNDKTNARKIINDIISEKSSYKERAENLLEEIDGN